jgi:endogenous inhibitor of DNA gyrase (YacG/DUF329 family)
MQNKPRLVACPTCKKLIEYNINNKLRPFCCERCQMIDLGDWANENFKIPDKTILDDNNEID